METQPAKRCTIRALCKLRLPQPQRQRRGGTSKSALHRLRAPSSPNLVSFPASNMSSPPLDLVTSLQEATARLNAMLFNYVGALQRDAPPQLLKQGDVLVGGAAAGHSYDVQVRGGGRG